MVMCTFENAEFFLRNILRSHIYMYDLGKNQTLTAQSKEAKDSEKGTDLDTFSTLGHLRTVLLRDDTFFC